MADNHKPPILGGRDDDAIIRERLAELDRTPRVDGEAFLRALLERAGSSTPDEG